MTWALASLDAAWWSAFFAGPLSLVVPLIGSAAAVAWGISIQRRLVRENRRLFARLAEAEAKTAVNCILSAVKMVEAAACGKHLELALKVDPAIPATLKGDSGRLRQVGLGLSISRRLVDLMDGEIEVQSHLGAGSTFRFTVRLQEVGVPVKACADMEILSKLTSNRLSVLIVEENALQRRLMTKLLESQGHQISPTSNVKQALDLFATDFFDLVLMNTHFADTDAIALASSMRELEGETTRTCIYALRSDSDPVSIPEYVNAGLDGCIPAFPSVEDLLVLVDKVVTREVLQI